MNTTSDRIPWVPDVLLALVCACGTLHAAEPVTAGGWQEHRVRQGDGKGSWVTRPALRRVLKYPDADFTMPFGLARLDNGEVALLCSREKTQPRGAKTFEPVIAFSKDGGATWSDFRVIPGAKGRPQYLEALGGGRLSFITEVFDQGAQPQRLVSNDYGHTWPERVEHPPTRDGRGFAVEGNAWIDRDEKGRARAILELGWHYAPGKSHPKDDATVVFRRSVDGDKTWTDEVAPAAWKVTAGHGGEQWLRGVSEGAIVRAANSDFVAALRTDMPPRYFDGPHDDSLEGTAISISLDDGKTWSGLQFLFEDRLWNRWLDIRGHRLPDAADDKDWYDQEFPFYDENGKQVVVSVSKILDLADKEVRYDDDRRLVAGAPAPAREKAVEPKIVGVGAVQPVLELSTKPLTKTLALTEDSKPKLMAALGAPRAGAEAPVILLRVEGMKPPKDARLTFEVFLTKKGEEPSKRSYVGPISFFGQRGGHAHGGNEGFTQGFDVTSMVQKLRTANKGVLRDLEVSVVPHSTAGLSDEDLAKKNLSIPISNITLKLVTVEKK